MRQGMKHSKPWLDVNWLVYFFFLYTLRYVIFNTGYLLNVPKLPLIITKSRFAGPSVWKPFRAPKAALYSRQTTVFVPRRLSCCETLSEWTHCQAFRARTAHDGEEHRRYEQAFGALTPLSEAGKNTNGLPWCPCCSMCLVWFQMWCFTLSLLDMRRGCDWLSLWACIDGWCFADGSDHPGGDISYILLLPVVLLNLPLRHKTFRHLLTPFEPGRVRGRSKPGCQPPTRIRNRSSREDAKLRQGYVNFLLRPNVQR